MYATSSARESANAGSSSATHVRKRIERTIAARVVNGGTTDSEACYLFAALFPRQKKRVKAALQDLHVTVHQFGHLGTANTKALGIAGNGIVDHRIYAYMLIH